MKYPQIGSVSHGTHHLEDLIPAFLDALRDISPEGASAIEGDPDTKLVLDAMNADDFEDFSSIDMDEAANATVETLFEALESYAPPYCYFGAVEGDGSDFGFWPAISALEGDAYWKDGVIKIDAGDSWPEIPDGVDYVMEVTDHGNVTLYNAFTHEEIWSCV